MTCAVLLLSFVGGSTAWAQKTDDKKPPPLKSNEPPPAATDQPPPAPTAPAGTAAKKPPATSAAPGPAVGGRALDSFYQGMLQLGYSGFAGLRVYKNGVAHSLGFMGLGGGALFEGSSYAADAYGTYKVLRIVGAVLWTAGMALLVTNLVLTLSESDAVFDSRNEIKPLFWGLLIPGGVVGVAGGIMIGMAPAYLSDAVRRYNSDLYRKLSGRTAGAYGVKISGRF